MTGGRDKGGRFAPPQGVLVAKSIGGRTTVRCTVVGVGTPVPVPVDKKVPARAGLLA